MSKQKLGPIYQKIVTNSLPKAYQNKTIIWGKEMKLAKKLYEKYPDKEFWESFEPMNKTRFSLTYYLTERGQEELELHRLKMKLEPEKQEKAPKVSKIKFGKNKTGKRKPKSIKELLDFDSRLNT